MPLLIYFVLRLLVFSMKHHTSRKRMVATESRRKSVISQIFCRIPAVPILIYQKKTQRELRKKALTLKCKNKTEVLWRQATPGVCHV